LWRQDWSNVRREAGTDLSLRRRSWARTMAPGMRRNAKMLVLTVNQCAGHERSLCYSIG